MTHLPNLSEHGLERRIAQLGSVVVEIVDVDIEVLESEEIDRRIVLG